ncbi:claudin-8-like [Denticeps clupeoides]|uniref:claudin-8-like n=1 Tax=Denticeps clupeoides TaxID=299321 RepID=UPI0010A45873|nr:claudin-8-like [Denticeps clupeoides]
MGQAVLELLALGLGLLGLVGTAAVTGMPMWRVTAFIGANIIVMETRWEGLWMNCYRQANIRMQCKVYDSLLYLSPDLQAARGLMCSAVALCAAGLLVAVTGLRSTSCMVTQPRVKKSVLMVAGLLQLLASVSVFVPVSWTGYVVVQDFHNPLLIDAQRRELGEALYIGWVTGGVLLASGLLFLFQCPDSKPRPAAIYRPAFFSQRPTVTMSSNMSSMPAQALNQPVPVRGVLLPPVAGTPVMFQSLPLQHSANGAPAVPPEPSDSIRTVATPVHPSRAASPYASHDSVYSFHPAAQRPLFVGYKYSEVQRASSSHSSSGCSGMRI